MTPPCSSFPLRLSTPSQEGILRVSKWTKYPVLLDDVEMEDLIAHLGDFFCFIVSDVVQAENAQFSKEIFLEKYRGYIGALKEGVLPDEMPLKRYFSSILSLTSDLLYGQEVGKDKFLVKALKPVVQLQCHHFIFSKVDQKFYPMVLGDESITWGIQFSYPQIYQDPKSFAYSKVTHTADFPNTALFLLLVQWLRKNTQPTPFIVGEQRVNVPIRIGKKCLPWIHLHPQLALHGLSCRGL